MRTPTKLSRNQPSVRRMGTRTRRAASATSKSRTKAPIDDNQRPPASVVSYETFVSIHQQLQSILRTLEVLASSEDRKALLAGLHDMKADALEWLDDLDAVSRPPDKQGR
jgi:hypothetical protein